MPEHFHPAVNAWFSQQFDQPTPVQQAAWRSIAARHPTLIAAPTGSGKTLAGFLAIIDGLIRDAVDGELDDRVRAVYVSPLRALSNDIERNLREPLSGIVQAAQAMDLTVPEIRVQVRTGDTPQRERQKMQRKPPHILVTTPESLFILLSSTGGRTMLSGVEAIIVDEVHAIVGSKRGDHLNLSLQRLAALALRPPLCVGISATVKPLDEVGCWLNGAAGCRIVDYGHQREWDLALEIPDEPLSAVLSNQAWEAIYDRLAEIIQQHRTTLIFANTRRLAERAAHHLSQRLDEDEVTAHHGSLSRERRLDTEQRLKQGALRAVVATASLELGIDIGHIDLVCQLGSPRAISALLQRVGRAGHRLNLIPKGRLWPLSRDDLVECTALVDCAKRGELDRIRWLPPAQDVLAQQIVSIATEPVALDDLYALITRSWVYRELPRAEFEQLVRMLSEGYSGRRGRRLPWLEWDKVLQQVRSRRHAGSVVMMNAGAIPDYFDYDVWLMPEETFIGTLNEDFAFESLPGDIFQLGNQCYRILQVAGGRVLVEDAAGAPPNIPFWFGDAPGRSDALSTAVARLRGEVAQALAADDARDWAQQRYGLNGLAARQLVDYLAAAQQALGCIPTQSQLVIERFFDETDNYHLVIHSPYGARLNRAWGLALRKRFCRRFNFELQAAAVDDAVILSLGPTHSFPLHEVLDYLSPASVQQVLTQAVLDAPMFAARWRWTASIALAVLRNRFGKRVPAQFQRNDAEDLMALIFPDSLACLENISGEREVPDHPLVRQTLRDCLEDVMDIHGLERLLGDIQQQRLNVRCVDLNGPSPLAHEILNAKPWAFLDDGAAEERRTLAVRQERISDQAAAAALAVPEERAILQVQKECRPLCNDAEDLHDALNRAGFFILEELKCWQADGWPAWLQGLQKAMRAVVLKRADGNILWLAAERVGAALQLWPDAQITPQLPAWALTATAISTKRSTQESARDDCLVDFINARLSLTACTSVRSLLDQLAVAEPLLQRALQQLEVGGDIVRMAVPPIADRDLQAGQGGERWCLRHLSARIRRLSRQERRGAQQPVAPRVFLRFLLERHGLDEEGSLADVDSALTLLQGWSAPAGVWESSILACRLRSFDSTNLDMALLAGGWSWRVGRRAGPALVAQSPVTLLTREALALAGPERWEGDESSASAAVWSALSERGALFMPDLRAASGLLQPRLDASLRQLAGAGKVHADSWSALRLLLRGDEEKRRMQRHIPRAQRGRVQGGIGRWAALPLKQWDEAAKFEWCWILLRRYGVIFRLLLERESLAPAWGELLPLLRRLEDRGEIYGGRFVSGVSGEQFALSEAVAALKRLRDQQRSTGVRIIHSYDPLAWAAVVAGAPRLALAPNHVLVLQGDTVSGWHAQDRWHWLQQQPPAMQLPRF